MAWCANPVTRMATTSGPELDEVFEQAEPVAAGTEVPVEDGEVDRVLVGHAKRGFGVRGREDAGAETRRREPFLEGPPDGLLVVHDEDGVGHVNFHDTWQPACERGAGE